MYIDPITLNWILISLASFCSGMIGFHIARKRNEEIIATTINYLSDEGFLRSFENEDGELEILKLNDGDDVGSKKNPDEA
jgi:hypothetical protein